MPKPIVCDTSIWLYMGRIGQVHPLSQLYEPVFTTESVCRELDVGRYSRPETVDPRQLSWVRLVQPTAEQITNLPTNRLGPGEQSVLAYAQNQDLLIVGLDDRQARVFAQQMGLHVIGTIGLLLKSKEVGLLITLRPLLEQLRHEGFYISESMFQYVIAKAKE